MQFILFRLPQTEARPLESSEKVSEEVAEKVRRAYAIMTNAAPGMFFFVWWNKHGTNVLMEEWITDGITKLMRRMMCDELVTNINFCRISKKEKFEEILISPIRSGHV